ncbi:MAG: hypothetical protein HY786_00510 [Deltaproteobacteria bacterium]|nr:hypothetical protein [Deltaproteobacteria bacterium]
MKKVKSKPQNAEMADYDSDETFYPKNGSCSRKAAKYAKKTKDLEFNLKKAFATDFHGLRASN